MVRGPRAGAARKESRGCSHRQRVRLPVAKLSRANAFSRFDADVRLPILTIPGVVGIVGIGKTPAAADPRKIEHIRRVTSVQRRSETRVVLSVTLLQKAISVQVDSDAVRPV